MTDWRDHRPRLSGANLPGASGMNRLDCTCGQHLGNVPTSAGMDPVQLLMAEHRAEQDD